MSHTAYSVEKIATIVKGQLFCNVENQSIEHILIDSRKAFSINNSLFVAIDGVHHDGHHYIKSLIKKGVANFIVSDKQSINEKANFILVEDSLKALQHLSDYHRIQFSYPIIAITGSNGKTIVKEWLYQLLKNQYNIVRSPKSYNSQVGVPLSTWLLNKDSDLGIFEAGISTVNEMQHLEKIIKPTIGIFTNIGKAHERGFSSIDEKIKEKARLFNNANQIIYCKDYDSIDSILTKSFKKEQLFYWSTKDNKALVYISKTTINENGACIELNYQKEHYKFNIPFADKASIENAIHCFCCLAYLEKLTPATIEQFNRLSPVSMRLEIKDGINNCSLINDTYNSDINSLKVALDLLNQQHGNKTVILSDIAESDNLNNELYKEVSLIINNYPISKFIGIGQKLYHSSDLFNIENKQFYLSTEEFIEQLKTDIFENEVILVKGARDFAFEKIIKPLELKAHKTRLEIDLNAMVDNLNYYRSILEKKTKIMAMVKAFSYGSGSTEIANLLEFHRIDYLAVAYADEGVTLRKAGITTPILVMNPDENSFDAIIKYDLEPEIYSFSILGKFLQRLENNFDDHKLPFPIHIKVDTGMHRLGFTPQEVNQLSQVLNSCRSSISVKSVFSHLAASDNLKEESFTSKQINELQTFSRTLKNNLEIEFLVHILNSGGIENYPQAQFDMVRLGIGLYGISSNSIAKKRLKPVSSLKSTISQIKLISEGDTVGYNRRGIIITDTKIAVVAIGYADGINRKLGNGNYQFIINGQKVKTIGDICMDMCMLDVSEINCETGDEVIIFDQTHPVEQIAKQLGTISYEVLTGISQRVKRIYFQE